MGDTQEGAPLVERIEMLSGANDPMIRLNLCRADGTNLELCLSRDTASSLVEAINMHLLRPPEAQASDRY